MLAGPVFSREAVVAPRRTRHYTMRAIYAAALLLLICTAWMLLTGTQQIRNVGDMARFGAILFQVLAPLQLALMLFLAAVQAASGIAIEKDRETLILLLMSRLSNGELVLGKMLASLLNVGVMLMTSLPIFMLIVLFGGTSFSQVGWTFAVTAVTVMAAGSLGTMIAFWREKTFQTLALVALAIVFWIGLFEAIGFWGGTLLGVDAVQIAEACSPLRAIVAASQPTVESTWPSSVLPYLIVAAAVTLVLCGVTVWRVRKWNPSRDVKPGQEEQGAGSSVNVITGEVEGLGEDPERQRAGHVDDRSRVASQKSRPVWDNPVLWREMCTWAYGRKILFIRFAYWLLAAFVAFGLYSLVTSGVATRTTADTSIRIAETTRLLAPFLMVSLVLVNALAVTSITTERDGRALDLLRVTDISPREFLFGKLFGILYVSADILILPMLMCVYLWWSEALTGEHLVYLFICHAVVMLFVAVLGIHCGMSYASSRQAIGASLGTVFFLFLGVVTSMVMMVSFTGNVEAQLAPFLACIVGGAIGLYVVLGWNTDTPSPALAIGTGLLPLAMFYCITSFLIKNYTSVVLVLAFTYGFTTTALVIPRLSEFIVSMGRTRVAEAE